MKPISWPFSSQDKVMIAFSCGSDSVFLFHQLLKFLPASQITLLYCDHGLRPEEVLRERSFVLSLETLYGVKTCIRKLPVRVFSEQSKTSLEASGRRWRYAMLAHIARLRNISIVLTAHHADDVVETVLHHLIRGTAKPPGIAASKRLNDDVMLFRPLLHLSKSDILSYLSLEKLTYFEDSSNQDVMFTRNKIRHQLLPVIRELNQGYVKHFTHFSDHYRDLYVDIMKYIQPFFESVMIKDGGLRIPLTTLLSLSYVKRGVFIRECLERLDSDLVSECSQYHISGLVDLDLLETGKQLTLPLGYIAQKNYDDVMIFKRGVVMDYRINITSIPFTVMLDDCGLEVSIQKEQYSGQPLVSTPMECVLNADNIDVSCFYIRNRHIGDMFHPFGKKHPERLSRYLIEKKVIRQERDILPLFFNRDDLVWVAGLAVSELVKVSSETRYVFRIRIKKTHEKISFF